MSFPDRRNNTFLKIEKLEHSRRNQKKSEEIGTKKNIRLMKKGAKVPRVLNLEIQQ